MKLTYDYANYLFKYDPETGNLYKRIKGTDKFRTKPSGTKTKTGYIQIGVDGKLYLAHRIIVLLINKSLSDGCQIDHIDHNRLNNKLNNLRVVNQSENMRNSSKRNDNSTGVTGVVYHKLSRKYMANIFIDGKRIYLGLFETLGEAAAVRREADLKYGYHKNHGS